MKDSYIVEMLLNECQILINQLNDDNKLKNIEIYKNKKNIYSTQYIQYIFDIYKKLYIEIKEQNKYNNIIKPSYSTYISPTEIEPEQKLEIEPEEREIQELNKREKQVQQRQEQQRQEQQRQEQQRQEQQRQEQQKQEQQKQEQQRQEQQRQEQQRQEQQKQEQQRQEQQKQEQQKQEQQKQEQQKQEQQRQEQQKQEQQRPPTPKDILQELNKKIHEKYDDIIRELKAGKKSSHWAWWAFPHDVKGNSELEPKTYLTNETALELINNDEWMNICRNINQTIKDINPTPTNPIFPSVDFHRIEKFYTFWDNIIKSPYNDKTLEIRNYLNTLLRYIYTVIKPTKPLETDIKHNGPIFTLSDIHGDINAFIITLRDCAKVIKKRVVFDPTKIDDNIETNLLIDINVNENIYDESLGYEWCGNNSFIVICGDMIDPYRGPKDCKTKHGDLCNKYPQTEIKLLKFINNISKQAQIKNGRIVKLLGNHELNNILSNTGLATKYTFTYDDNYYKDIERRDIFNVGQPGFKLLFEDGCNMLIKINNSIFVHGQLPKIQTINDIDKINKFINNNDYQDRLEIWENVLNEYDSDSGPLWDREWSLDKNIDERIQNNKQTNYCDNIIKKEIKRFLGNMDINNIRVVLGHCPQYFSSTNDNNNTTMTKKIRNDQQSKTYSSEKILEGKINANDQDTIFGITMQCPKPIKNGKTDFFVYHVDIGSSRGFDSDYSIIKNIQDENRHLFSRTPQILSIDQNENITIIKSKMKNTRIHLPRYDYEEMIKGKPELSLSSNNYDKKYRKYKQKYLELKNIVK